MSTRTPLTVDEMRYLARSRLYTIHQIAARLTQGGDPPDLVRKLAAIVERESANLADELDRVQL